MTNVVIVYCHLLDQTKLAYSTAGIIFFFLPCLALINVSLFPHYLVTSVVATEVHVLVSLLKVFYWPFIRCINFMIRHTDRRP